MALFYSSNKDYARLAIPDLRLGQHRIRIDGDLSLSSVSHASKKENLPNEEVNRQPHREKRDAITSAHSFAVSEHYYMR